MGDTAKRFSSLLTVICRTAKRSANKVAKIRRKKNGGEDMNNVPPKADAVVVSPGKTRVSKSSASSVDEKGICTRGRMQNDLLAIFYFFRIQFQLTKVAF